MKPTPHKLRPRPSRWHEHWLILALYTLLTLILTWPLITHITTHVPGAPTWAFDESTFLWNIWYFKHAVIDLQTTPLHSDLIWHPLGIDLVLYTYNFFHVLLAIPLSVAINLPFASNVALLLSTVLSAYGTYLLVRYEIRITKYETGNSQLAAFAAGLVYAFASNRAIYATLGHYDMVTTQWIPFYALMLLRSLDGTLGPQKRRKAAMLAGVFFAFTGLAEMISALFLGMFTLIVLAVWLSKSNWYLVIGNWSRRRSKHANYQLPITNLFITALVAFLIWSPALLPILRQFLTEDFSLKGWGEAIPLSADLLGWLTPTVLHPLLGGDLVAELRRVQLRALAVDGTGFRDINTVFLGWITLLLAVIGVVALRRKIAIWGWTALIFGLFTLGPFLQINGQYRFDLDGESATIPLPFALLHYLPIIKANRAPNRNSVLLMLGLAVLVGYGCNWLLLVIGNWRLGKPKIAGQGQTSARPQLPITNYQLPFTHKLFAMTLCTLLLFEHLALPLPLSDARIPAVYEQIAADPRLVSVLQLPLGWRNSFETFGPETTLLQYYQAAHGKPLIGGNISRAPQFKMDYFRRIPYFQALTEIEFGRPVDPAVIEAARRQAPDLLRLYNVGYVILYPPIPNRYPYVDHWQAAWEFVKSTLPLEAQPFWAQDGIEAYRVQPFSGDSFRLDLGAADTFPYRAEGWDSNEIDTIYDQPAIWASAPQSTLLAGLYQIDPVANYEIALRVRPFAYPGSTPQRVRLVLNDQPLAEQTLSDDWQTITWPVVGSDLQEGTNRLRLDWGYAASPRQVLGGDRQIGSSGVALPIDAELKSFADGAWIALFDEAGAQIDASAGRRGVNVTVLDPVSGRVIEQRGFDTAANEFENQALVKFLDTIAVGQIVLIAKRGAEAGKFLDEKSIVGLGTLGALITLEQVRDHYFAIIGVKGAAGDSALMVVDPTDATLVLSRNRDRRTLAAAVDWLTIAAQR